jgi:threonine synthase
MAPATVESLATGLVCIDCGANHALGYRLQCVACGGLLELTYDLSALGRAGPASLTGDGLWRYAPVLPIADPAHRVTLGEGQSPLLPCPALAKHLGVRRLLAKFALPPSREAVAFDEASLRRLVRERLGSSST